MTDRSKPPQNKQPTPKTPQPKAAKKPAQKKTVAAAAPEIVRREQAASPAPALKAASRPVPEAPPAMRREKTAPAPRAAPPRKAAPPPPPQAAAKVVPNPAASAPAPKAPMAKPASPGPAPAPKPAASAPAASASSRVPSSAPPPLAARPDHLLAGAAETLQQSFKAAGRGTAAVNRKLMEIAQQNVTSGFDLARSLARATTPLEAARLQFAFWDDCMKAFASHAEELRALSATVLAEANEPLRKHVKRSFPQQAA
jgi:hypothetical protein